MPTDKEQRDEEPIPKLPRAPLFRKLSVPAIVRIGMFATLLYAIIVMRQPCADGVGRFITNFDDPPDAGPAVTTDQRIPGYELMTAEEALKRWPDKPAEDAAAASDSGNAPVPIEGARSQSAP